MNAKKEQKYSIFSDSLVQAVSFFVTAAAIPLIVPYPGATEVDNINFIHDFMNNSINISQANYSNFLFASIVYIPTLLIRMAAPSLPNSHVLVLWKLLFTFLSTLTVSMTLSQMKRVFGKRTSNALFVLSLVSCSSVASKLSNDWICFNLMTLCVAFWVSSNMLSALACALLCLPVFTAGRSLAFLLALAPLLVNATTFDRDPLAVFSYLCTTLMAAFIDSSLPFSFPDWKAHLWNPNLLLIASVVIFTASRRSSTTFKLSTTAALGFLLLKNESFLPFLLTASALSASVKETWIYSWLFKAACLTLSLQSAISVTNFSLQQAAGPASFYFNNLLHANLPASAHVSATAMSLGFSKMAAKPHPQVEVEFGTQYHEREMLQKFMYRIADINEHIDPAHWRVYHIQQGWQNGQMRPMVKILIRRPVDY